MAPERKTLAKIRAKKVSQYTTLYNKIHRVGKALLDILTFTWQDMGRIRQPAKFEIYAPVSSCHDPPLLLIKPVVLPKVLVN